jgi:ketosteroid isomerase-like protein
MGASVGLRHGRTPAGTAFAYAPSPVSDNVELVRRSFEAISAWDIGALLRVYHPEVEFLPLTGTHVETGGYRGHDGVRAYLEEAEDLWEVLEPDGNHYEDLGDRVVVSGTCRVRGRASGAESRPACAWVIGVRDGLIVSHTTCSTLEQAEKLAGVERAEGGTR